MVNKDVVRALPTNEEVQHLQANDTLCRNFKAVLKENVKKKTANEYTLLCWKAATGRAIQANVSEHYKKSPLYYRQYPTLAGHPGKTEIYDIAMRAYY